MNAAVLIVTNERDIDADRVVRELDRRGVAVLRCNTERFSKWRVLHEVDRGWSLTDPLGREATSDSVRAVWWRRPEPPDLSLLGLSPGRSAAVADQWQTFAEGLMNHGERRWVSRPDALHRAEDKVLQLKTARRMGFAVPETVVLNDRDDAKRFIARHGGRVIAKSLTAAHWEEQSEAAFVFARLITEDDLPAHDSALQRAPVVMQQAIHPKHDVRATVVGDHVFAAATPPTKTEIDWRLEPERQWTATDLSTSTTTSCLALARGLGLRYAGIDLAIDDDGVPWFLEANPNGEWGWLVGAAGLPIPEAIANELAA